MISTQYIGKVHKIIITERCVSIIPSDVDQFYYVKIVNFERNNILKLPSELFNLNLWTLIVCNNKLTILPKELGNLSELVLLTISYNKLREIPIEILKLKKLNCVFADGNMFQNVYGNLPYERLLSLQKSGVLV